MEIKGDGRGAWGEMQEEKDRRIISSKELYEDTKKGCNGK